MERRLVIGFLASVGLAAAPAAAGAAQFCVGAAAGPTCDGGTYPFTATSLNDAALAADARAGADELRLGPGTIAGAAAITSNGSQGLNVTGAPLSGPPTVLEFATGTTIGISTTGYATVSNLTLRGNGTGTAIAFGGGTGQLALRLRISGFATGVSVSSTQASGTSVSDSVIDLGATANARGIYTGADSANDSSVTVHRVTVGGSGDGQTGISTFTFAGGAAHTTTNYAALYLTGTGSVAFRCSFFFGGTPTASQTGSAFRTPGNCAGIGAPAVDLSLANPWFVNAAAGDYRLLSYSPLIDENPTMLLLSTLDASGQTRRTDGDGDGIVRPDLGGLEYRRQAPDPPVIDMPVTTVAPGEALPFKATATDPDGELPFVTWDFGDGSGAAGFQHAYAALGTFTATATATDPVGLKTSSTIQITVANPPVPPATPTPLATPKVDPFATATGPRVRILKAPTKSIKRSTNGFATIPTPDSRTATIESAGAVTLRVKLTRLLSGRKATSKASCKTSTRKGKRCTVRRPVSSIGQVPVTPGTIVLRFGGKLGTARLAAGKYEVSVTPVGIDKVRGPAATYAITLR